MGTNALNDRRAGLDVPLTKISLGIKPDQKFIGDALLPVLSQPLSIATIPVWGTEAFRIREDRVGDFSEPDKLDVSIDKTTLEIDGHAFMGPVSRRQQIESMRGPFQIDLDEGVLRAIKATMALAREKMQADLMTSQSIYAASHKQDQNGLARLWSDPLIDPLDDIAPMIDSIVPDSSGEMPNTFWMGQQVWAALKMNPLVRHGIYGQLGPQPLPTFEQFAKLIGIERILIGRAISKTPGGVNTKLWGKNAGLTYVPPTAGKQMPAFGYTVEQTVFEGSSEKVFRFPDEKMGASGGDWIKRSQFYTPTILFPDAGVLFYNAVA